MAKISTPVPGYNGRVAGVQFEDGVGETDDEAALAYFAGAGYTIEGADGFEQDPSDDDKPLPILGNEFENPPVSPYADAADPANDMVPVGGVKSNGTVVAGKAKGKRVAPAPSQPVQETSVPGEQSATPAAANPPAATQDGEQSSTDSSDVPDSGSGATPTKDGTTDTKAEVV